MSSRLATIALPPAVERQVPYLRMAVSTSKTLASPAAHCEFVPGIHASSCGSDEFGADASRESLQHQ